MSEEMVVRQAAPTLAGIKTGSLFPCPCAEKDVLLGEIRAFNRRYLSRAAAVRRGEGAFVPLPSGGAAA